MPDNKRFEELLNYLKANKMIRNQQDFVERIDSDKASVSQIKNGKIEIPNIMFGKIKQAFPSISIEWLKEGVGEVSISEEEIFADKQDNLVMIPLLPISAQAGTLNDFIVSVKNNECERVISPILGADFAITIAGDSMSPEFPGGSQILIKKIDENAFINWGNVFVLDTCNGVVVKKVYPVEGEEDSILCESINPKYPPFKVSKKDIYGFYRVMMCMSIK